MGCRKRGSYAQGVYPTQDTSRMGSVRVKQEEKSNTKTITMKSMKFGRKESGYKGESPKRSLTSAKDLTIKHTLRRDSPYHRSDQNYQPKQKFLEGKHTTAIYFLANNYICREVKRNVSLGIRHFTSKMIQLYSVMTASDVWYGDLEQED